MDQEQTLINHNHSGSWLLSTVAANIYIYNYTHILSSRSLLIHFVYYFMHFPTVQHLLSLLPKQKEPSRQNQERRLIVIIIWDQCPYYYLHFVTYTLQTVRYSGPINNIKNNSKDKRDLTCYINPSLLCSVKHSMTINIVVCINNRIWHRG